MAPITRREALVATAAVAASPLLPRATAAAVADNTGRVVRKGRLKQSVSRWCYKDIPDRDFYKAVADIGLPAVDLLGQDQWPIVREFGLVCAMGYGGG